MTLREVFSVAVVSGGVITAVGGACWAYDQYVASAHAKTVAARSLWLSVHAGGTNTGWTCSDPGAFEFEMVCTVSGDHFAVPVTLYCKHDGCQPGCK